MSTIARAPGQVVTFYSYKGGTGRSMALANVAWILAANGKRVLVLDWDLEAPGLHRYFAPFLADHELMASDGVIDFLGRYADAVLTPARTDADKRADWYLDYADITNLATSLTYKFPAGGTLDFIGAGRQGPAYAARIANFPWQTFYDRLGGGTLIDAARDVMKAEYDYVLLDSRTGVSDAAGICTMQLPDALVVCFTLNNQSIAGAANIARIVDQKAVGGRSLPVFPVATRVENAETDKLEARRRFARSRFTLFPQGMDQAARDAYWGAMEVRYVPYYAYEEVLAVFGDAPGREGTVLSQFERLTSYMTGGAVTRLPAMPERQRLLHRDMFARQSDRASGTRDVVSDAERLLGELGPDGQRPARRLLTRLVRVARAHEGGVDTRARVPRAELTTTSEELLRHFASGGIVRVEADASLGDDVVELAEDALLQAWPTMGRWLEEDRDFLAWRQAMRTALAEWERTSRDRGALLSGQPLAEARAWLTKHRDDFTAAELAFIDRSEQVMAEEAERERARQEEQHRISEALREREATLAALQEAHGRLAMPSPTSQASWVTRHARWLAAALSVVTLASIGVASFGRKAGTAAPPGTAPVPTVAALIQSGRDAARLGSDSVALAEFDRAVAMDSLSPDAFVARGEFYEAQGAYPAAVADYDRALARDSTSTNARFHRAVALRQMGNLELARVDLTAVLAREPNNAAALYERAQVLERTNEPRLAIADYGALLRADSSMTGAYARRGRLYLDRRDTAAAVRDLQRAATLGDTTDTLSRASAALLARLQPRSVGPTGTPRAIETRVALQYRDSADVKAITDVYLSLRRQRSWRVDAPELVRTTGSLPQAGRGIVRFFFADDRGLADAVRDAMLKELLGRGYTVALSLDSLPPRAFPGARRGVIEVWVGSLGHPPAAAKY